MHTRASPSPLHIGIFRDHRLPGADPTDTRILIEHLADGLLSRRPCPRVTILDVSGDKATRAAWQERWGAKVELAAAPLDWGWLLWRRPRRALANIVSCVPEPLFYVLGRITHLLTYQPLSNLVRHWRTARSRRSGILTALFAVHLLCVAALGLPLAFALWGLAIIHNLIRRFLLPTLSFPVRMGVRALARTLKQRPGVIERCLTELGCDVWLTTNPGSDVVMPVPHVLMIGDLVALHMPEALWPAERAELERILPERVSEANRIYCPSRWVNAIDLRHAIPDEIERVRVFPLAAPTCRVEDSTLSLDALCVKFGVGPRFLYYPADMAPRHGHQQLMEGLRAIHRHWNDPQLELVCTGTGRVPWRLRRWIKTVGLARHVHFLGQVSTADAEALYRHAQAVPFPAVYEQSVWPLFEALARGCAIVCADTPTYRELLEEQWEAVLFFDPLESFSMARAITRTIRQRDYFRRSQMELHRRLRRRDWGEVADDFLRIFEEVHRSAPRWVLTAPEQPPVQPVERMSHAA